MLVFLFACSTNTKMAEYSALNFSNCTTFLLLSSWSERGHESDSGDHFHITSVNPQRAQIVLLSFYSTLSYLSESGPQFKDCSKKLINNVLENVKKKKNKPTKITFLLLLLDLCRCWIIWSIMSVFYQEFLITVRLLTTIPFRLPNLILNLDSTIQAFQGVAAQSIH